MAEPTRFVFNERGEKIAAVISIEEYEKLLDTLGDLDDIREYQESKASGDTGVTLEEAIARIERSR